MIQKATKVLLKELGFDLKDPNFRQTPERVKRMWTTFCTPEPFTPTTFPLKEKTRGIIILKDHVTWGFCPHHLLPVEYTFRIGYLPSDRVLGLSKLARLANSITSTMPLQEDIAPSVVNWLNQLLHPKGCGCTVHGKHFCTRIRGVQSPCAEAVTSVQSGIFLTDQSCRDEFLNL